MGLSPFVLKVVAALPEDMRADFNPSGFSLELAVCVLSVGLLAVVLFLWRGFRSVSNHCMLGEFSLWVFSSFFFFKVYFMCMNVLPAYVYLYHMCAWYTRR